MMLLEHRNLGRLSMGANFGTGPNYIGQHIHNELEQWYIMLPGASFTYTAENEKIHVQGGDITYTPHGSHHGSECADGEKFAYVWFEPVSYTHLALCAFYTQGQRSGETYPVRDEAAVLNFFAVHAGDTAEALVTALAARENFWGQDLNRLPGFTAAAADDLQRIRRDGMAAAMEACRKEAVL